MPDLVYGSGAVEQVRTAVAAEARRVPALADGLAVPTETIGRAVAVGGGPAAGSLVDAVHRALTALTADLTTAGRRLDALDRALDATRRSMETADADAAVSWRRGG